MSANRRLAPPARHAQYVDLHTCLSTSKSLPVGSLALPADTPVSVL